MPRPGTIGGVVTAIHIVDVVNGMSANVVRVTWARVDVLAVTPGLTTVLLPVNPDVSTVGMYHVADGGYKAPLSAAIPADGKLYVTMEDPVETGDLLVINSFAPQLLGPLGSVCAGCEQYLATFV